MRSLIKISALFAFVLIAISTRTLVAQTIAPTPPMGWNSWDAYGLTIDEAQFRANVSVLASIKQYGWQYAVIDEGWYMENPFGDKLATRKYLLDANGNLIPVPARFPSAANGAGFKPLADWVHSQGLKFGIHILRGIPKQAVEANAPINGTSFHAADVADVNATCGWDDGNYGVRDNEAGQAYYDQLLRFYAGWGLDYLKVDCISDHPYRSSEIRQIATAIQKSGRPILLSLSPGPTQLEHADEVAKYSQMWRISNDHWDIWRISRKTRVDEYPFSTYEVFDRIAQWNPYVKPGTWPDADMLPWGSLTPHPGMGDPRPSRLTHTEEQTELALWAISRSPLILGADLTNLDDFTRSLITNKAVLNLNQQAVNSHPIKNLPAEFENLRVWIATEDASPNAPKFLALFNLDDKPLSLHLTPEQLELPKHPTAAINLFDGSTLKPSSSYQFSIPPHGTLLYQFKAQAKK